MMTEELPMTSIEAGLALLYQHLDDHEREVKQKQELVALKWDQLDQRLLELEILQQVRDEYKEAMARLTHD